MKEPPQSAHNEWCDQRARRNRPQRAFQAQLLSAHPQRQPDMTVRVVNGQCALAQFIGLRYQQPNRRYRSQGEKQRVYRQPPCQQSLRHCRGDSSTPAPPPKTEEGNVRATSPARAEQTASPRFATVRPTAESRCTRYTTARLPTLQPGERPASVLLPEPARPPPVACRSRASQCSASSAEPVAPRPPGTVPPSLPCSAATLSQVVTPVPRAQRTLPAPAQPTRPCHAAHVVQHLVVAQAHAHRHHRQKHCRRNDVFHCLPLHHSPSQT